MHVRRVLRQGWRRGSGEGIVSVLVAFRNRDASGHFSSLPLSRVLCLVTSLAQNKLTRGTTQKTLATTLSAHSLHDARNETNQSCTDNTDAPYAGADGTIANAETQAKEHKKLIIPLSAK
ncbi:hypothetical protein TGARI_201190 [Toxoplasma gondii ARI]|uniref:Uncharacterized protein n=1 Tax=Toxoplasma gondii ARI TaxID=1074872 RepID=A0A139XZ21_TOXGO|nr:hypothetical protein TGARI_201190 [Toxoplasma gondii ARI]